MSGPARASSALRDGAVERVEALLGAARSVTDRETELGRRTRRLLVESTGLSPAGVELALSECLETAPTPAEIQALVASVDAAPRVHVVLPANVFVATHRALALALAASPTVRVRPSRREPHFARLLAAAAPGLFELTDALDAEDGDHVWAYGGDTSLAAVRDSLPEGARLRAQGPGYGIAVVEASQVSVETARALAADIVPFDQRGCLSPRAVLVTGAPADAFCLAELTADALAEANERVPLGRLDELEQADARAFRDAHHYAGPVFSAGPGVVAVGDAERWALAPVGRNLVVIPCSEPRELLLRRAPELTALGSALGTARLTELRVALPSARHSPVGRMQRPPFDGPVDRR